MTATMAEINEEVSVNPDAQSAVTDFLDYTEYLPTDLMRSLKLLGQLDQTYLDHSGTVHDLTRTYGVLPSIPSNERPNATKLRQSISQHLTLAMNARRSAYAEAERLYDLVDRHQDRLNSIIAKLEALPKPPSRDPTPQPQPASAVKAKTLKPLNNTTRITLKASQGTIASSVLPRPRHRRVTVPGEVMPPFNPDEPIASTEVSDWDSEPPSPVRAQSVPKSRKQRSTTEPERRPRETASYRKPTPPPEDAILGGEYRPWLRLTEYEMYKLRKKMKKNHTWEPSPVMIKRELVEKGRGWENYLKAKAAASANGTPFVDVDANPQVQVTAPTNGDVVKSTSKTDKSKGAKKAEKAEKKKNTTKKELTATPDTQLAARRLGDLGATLTNPFANLFQNFKNSLGSITSATSPLPTPKAEPKTSKKRKLEVAPSVTPSAEPEAQPKKKQKLLPKPSPLGSVEPSTAAVTVPKVPIKLVVKPPASVSPATDTPVPAARPSSANQRISAIKTDASPPPSEASSRRRSNVASAETSTAASARPSRRTSTTPAPVKATILDSTLKTPYTAASRRPKREAPGTVTQSSQDGGAAVSVSQRKTKPQKAVKVTPKAAPEVVKPEIRTDVDGRQEVVDPGEDRYCICGDVSWGEMIACELEDKCEFGEWFHMECVNLTGMPPRTTKWYCPGDRKKYHKGEKTNGLVRHGL